MSDQRDRTIEGQWVRRTDPDGAVVDLLVRRFPFGTCPVARPATTANFTELLRSPELRVMRQIGVTRYTPYPGGGPGRIERSTWGRAEDIDVSYRERQCRTSELRCDHGRGSAGASGLTMTAWRVAASSAPGFVCATVRTSHQSVAGLASGALRAGVLGHWAAGFGDAPAGGAKPQARCR